MVSGAVLGPLKSRPQQNKKVVLTLDPQGLGSPVGVSLQGLLGFPFSSGLCASD